jgi:hypothetical protein
VDAREPLKVDFVYRSTAKAATANEKQTTNVASSKHTSFREAGEKSAADRQFSE